MSDELPEGWVETRLSRVIASSFYGPRFSSGDYADSGIPTVRTTDMDAEGRIVLRDPPRVQVKPSDLEKFVLKDGDLLVTRTGSIGRCALYTEDIGPAIPSAYLIRFRLRCEAVESRYVLQFLASPTGQRQLGLGATAVTQPNINAKTIGDFQFLLPPLPEQRRIVSKVEALLARVNVARERLEKVPLLLKRFRQAVLAKVFRGELVPTEAELAAREGRSFQSADELLGRPPDVVNDELPEGWALVMLSKLGEFINGDRGKNYPSKDALVRSGIPFINAGHLDGGRVTFSAMNYISEERFGILGSGKVKSGDVLYCLRGSLGKAAVVNGIEHGAIASSLLIIRPSPVLLPEFLYFFFVSPVGQEWIRKFDNGSAQPNLSAGNVKQYQVPVPPLAEQRRIVAKVEALLAAAAKVEAEAQRLARQLERAAQAILQKAFSGELVPTEAELARIEGRPFESAAELLARIDQTVVGPGRATSRQGRGGRSEDAQTAPVRRFARAAKSR